MIKRVLAIAAVLVMATSTTACTPLGAICGAWLATPCIICFSDGTTTDNPPPGAVDVSAELPMTPMTTPPNTSTTMQY